MDRALSPHPIELSRSPNAVTSGLNGWLSCKDQETLIERLSPDAVDVRAARLWPPRVCALMHGISTWNQTWR